MLINGCFQNLMNKKSLNYNFQFTIHILQLTVYDFQESGRGAAW